VNAGADWLTSLKPEWREHIEKNKYPTDDQNTLMETLLISDVGAMNKLGRPQSDLIIKPNGTFEENRDAYLQGMRAFGAPEDKAGYGEAPTIEGMEFKDGMWDGLTAAFADIGVPEFMVKPVLEKVGELVKGQVEGAAADVKTPEQLKQEGIDALAGEVGQAKAMQMLDDATTLLKSREGGVEFAQYLDEKGLGNDPRMAKFLSGIMADYKESGIHLEPGQSGDAPVMSKQQAAAELDKLEADPSFKKRLMDRTDPGHKAAVDKRAELAAIAFE